MSRINSAHEIVIDSLYEALFQLMENKKMNEITVKELCNKAGVSRVSFYRNFDFISDIPLKYLSDQLENWWFELNQNKDPFTPSSSFWEQFFKQLKKNERIIKLLYRSNASFIIKDIVFRSCGPEQSQNDNEAFLRSILAGSIYGYTDEWIRRGMKELSHYPSFKELFEVLLNNLS